MAQSHPPRGRRSAALSPTATPAPPGRPREASPPIERYRDAYITVHQEAEGLLLRLTRSALPHPDAATLRRSFEGVIQTLDRLGRKGRVMLFDTRAPIGRNDPWFEESMATLRPRIDQDFVCIGVLVASAVGALQLRRWVSADGIERIIASREDELLAALLTSPSSRPQ